MTEVLTLLLGVVVVVLITVATAWFVGQEFAYMSVDRSRLKARASEGDAAAKRALDVTRRTSFMLSGAQLGITVTGLLAGYVAAPLIGGPLDTMLGGLGTPAGLSAALGGILALLLATFVQMLFGELFPKNLAIAKPDAVARWLSLSTRAYLKAFGWLIWVFDQSSNLLLRTVGLEPVHDVDHAATPRDLEHIVADSRDTGDLPSELSALLDRILDFPTRNVGHAMVPRARVDTVRPDDPLHEIKTRMGKEHSRYPVLGDDAEDVLGVVHLQDVLGASDEDIATKSAGSIARTAVVVPTTLPLPDAVRQLRTERSQLACVIDEYGGFAGVITTEDMAEELVGEITDEHDPETSDLAPEAQDGSWVAAGDMHIDEMERTLGHALPQGDYETIAGLVITHHGGFPEVGAEILVPLPPDSADLISDDEPPDRRILVEVLDVDRHVPSSLRVRLQTEPDDGAEEAR